MADLDEQIEKIQMERKHAHALYSEPLSVSREFLHMEREAFAQRRLTAGEKELIVAGISAVINCESCMKWHIDRALDAGMSRAQVLEAIGVDLEMGGGPATVVAQLAA